MHELSITQAILEVALDHANLAGANRILRIYLTIGDLSGVVGESVQFYFDFLSQDTPARGAELVLQRVPAQFHCRACGEVYKLTDGSGRRFFHAWACPACGELQPEVIGGRECLVESIEVE